MKKSVANPIRSVLALIISIMLGGLFAQLNAQTAPSTYSAYTGTDVKAVPPAPALGPANSVVTDPTFGSKILRVTDANTNGGESFISTDAGNIRTWNSNSTAIKLTGPHGDGYWMAFDPTNFKVDPQIHAVPFGATWGWSTIDPDIIYYLHGSKIAKYNKSTGVTTDLGGPSTGEPVAYMAAVVGQDNWVCAAAGAGQQDTYTKIFCVNPVSPSTTKFIDVVNKTINGVKQSDPGWPTSAAGQTLGIHGMSGGTGANYVGVTFHQQSWGGNGDAVLDLGTNTWSCLTNGDIYWGGHTSMGNGMYANASGSQDGRDSRGMLLRNPDALMNTSQYKFVGVPPAPSNGWCDADHSSWLNSLTNPNAPILQSRYGGSSGCAYAWTGEIIGIAVDGSNTVWRFAHNHNNGFQCYYGQSFAQVSNDGKWALFSSSWDGKLGSDTAFGCTTRIDTFIIALVPGASGSNGGNSGSTGGTSSGSTGGTSSGSTGGTSSGSTGGTSSGSAATGAGNSNSGTGAVDTTAGRGAGAATNADGRLEEFAIGADGQMYHVWQTTPGGAWSGWYSLGGIFSSGVGAAENRDGRLEVFGIGGDGQMYHAWQTSPGGGWTRWYSLGGGFLSGAGAAENGDGRLEVFGIGSDYQMYHAWQTSPGGGWTRWYSLGGGFLSGAGAAKNGDGRLEVFGIGGDRQMYHSWQASPGGGWTRWYSLGGGFSSSAGSGAAENGDGRVEVFGIGDDHRMYHSWQRSPGGGWSGWFSF